MKRTKPSAAGAAIASACVGLMLLVIGMAFGAAAVIWLGPA